MTDSRKDIRRHQDAVRKYLATPAKDLGITDDMAEASAPQIEVAHLRDLSEDSVSDAKADSSYDVPVRNLADFLGRIASVDLGDIALTPNDRTILRARNGDQYEDELQKLNHLVNRVFHHLPKDSLLKHIAFIDALENMLSNGTRIPQQVVKDELAILQGLNREHNTVAANLSQAAEREAPDDRSHMIRLLANARIATYRTNETPLPEYASHLEPEIEKMMDMGDEEKSRALKGILDELTKLMLVNERYDLTRLQTNKEAFQTSAENSDRSTVPLTRTIMATQALAKLLGINLEQRGRGNP